METEYDALRATVGIAGLIGFVAMFAVVLVYALRPRNRKKFRDAAHIPLRED